MKKLIAILAILLMAFSFPAIAQDEGGEAVPTTEPVPPTEAPVGEPVPPPIGMPTPPAEEPRDEPVPSVEGPLAPPGEQPVTPPVPGGPGAPGSGGQPQQPNMCYLEGKQIPCDQMPRPDDRPPQTGPGSGGCWVGEQQVPCPGEGPRLPQGCKEIIEPNGMRRVDCGGQDRPPGQMPCTSGPERERIEQKCKEQGGRIVTRNIDSGQGCGIVDCVFGQQGGVFMPPGQQQTCPSPETLMQKEESCRSMGLNPVRKRSNCEYVECEDPNRQGMQCPDNHGEWERVGMECSQKGGRVVKAFDENGCNIPKCVVSGGECPRDVPQEAYWKCEDQGGKLVVNTDEQGCITFSKCVKRGEAVREDDYNELDEVPPAAKLLQVALKLESIKISFDKLAKQIEAIAEYYEGEDDFANAERFRRAAGMFESAKSQIDGVKEELKMAVKGMSLEQLRDVKYKIRQITDVVMEDALFIILGGEAEGGYEYKPAEKEDYGEGLVPENELDCGSDGMCFEKALRVCEKGAVFFPDQYASLKIIGVDGSSCIIKGEADTPEGAMEMECRFPDFATNPLRPETLLPTCEGRLAEDFKKRFMEEQRPMQEEPAKLSREEVFAGQMMGCEKVEKGINQRGVCGNGCCEERYGESHYSCPRDCMAPQQQQIQQAPMMQRVRQTFAGEPGFEGNQGEMGCDSVARGLKPMDVCGNGCCEPGESRSNCPNDCMGEPMPDEGAFFQEGRGPAYQQRQMPQEPRPIPEAPVQGIEPMPEEWRQPPEPVPVEEVPATEEVAVETSSGGGGTTEPASSSGGGGGELSTAAVLIDAVKEFLGR
ncbi:MAG: hypothetical protein KJ955_03190 [Nanoarchaeota archaeon]|nr:hypothetical protein [Nanoarchaeota archaeon]